MMFLIKLSSIATVPFHKGSSHFPMIPCSEQYTFYVFVCSAAGLVGIHNIKISSAEAGNRSKVSDEKSCLLFKAREN